ncbi:hypothetical protein NDU88_005132 [Pleurodeles waltl]|uniref:Uncharacterized protein n=1 Tax=Pleurodeles waltl TaxID=8319 RepID=A0AAV7W9K1_PLEWA|nr:hypothetical protein NDU88_005132 [Pleurodeles waltl]
MDVGWRAEEAMSLTLMTGDVVNAAALQQRDPPAEGQAALVGGGRAAVRCPRGGARPSTASGAGRLLAARVERGVHADLALAPREGPVNDASLHRLRNALEALLHPLEGPFLCHAPRRDVQQRLGALRATRQLPETGHRARPPRARPAPYAIARSAAESLGGRLLSALRHGRTASGETAEVPERFKLGTQAGGGPRLGDGEQAPGAGGGGTLYGRPSLIRAKTGGVMQILPVSNINRGTNNDSEELARCVEQGGAREGWVAVGEWPWVFLGDGPGAPCQHQGEGVILLPSPHARTLRKTGRARLLWRGSCSL